MIFRTDPFQEPGPATALNYQAGRSLDRCPGFLGVVQANLAGGRRIAAALRRDAIEIHTTPDIQYLFDLEGRFLRAATRTEFRFRGCSHQGSIARRKSGGMIRETLPREELDRVCRSAWETAEALLRAVGEGRTARAHPDTADTVRTLRPVLERVVSWTPDRLARDAARFAAIYQPIPILPPDQYAAFVLQATEGCSFNTCSFCNLYRGFRFRVRSTGEFEAHLKAALAFHGEGLRRRNTIFLGQANAIAAPQARLESFLQTINNHVELPHTEGFTKASWAEGHRLRFLGIGSFLDGFTGLKKTPDDYGRLRRLGLNRVTLGVESGSDALLKWLKKPATTEEMRQTLSVLRRAGIRCDIILLVGAGGSRRAEDHARSSLEFLASASMEAGDRVYLSDMIAYPGTPYPEALKASGSRPLSPEEMREQREALRDGARRLNLKAVPYRLEPFIY